MPRLATFTPGKLLPTSPPSLGNRITHKHDGSLVLLGLATPCRSAIDPYMLEPIGAPNRACTGKTVVGGRNLEPTLLGLGRGDGIGGTRGGRKEREAEHGGP